ncbi:glycosyltransferase family 2 protein [Actinotalea sp. K2]|uniref:glycosyltransferase family 2 protein n=1 Tax=Actinotalea sp. K2 TaxID=2939438 RepID=UPI002016B34C|nr:glycosyltransferase [Actinotalea sp. K2]MCL3861294.1 glycosyltransferase [Actinotalea sp. K2]
MDVMPAAGRRVAVAVLTYQRPDVLGALLPELARQARVQVPPARVVVVDNDPGASARAAVEELDLPEVTFVHEPRPGIAAGRNAALREASDVDTLVFIDDDETPEGEWLSVMVDTHARLGGAALAGPVLRVHESPPASWVRAARVFDRRRMPTGTPLEAAGSGNLLLDMRHVRRHGLEFDDRLGLAGGSDHLFTKQIRQTDGQIYWCDEAVVSEFVPSDRLTGRWTLRRGHRSGTTSVLVELMLASTRGKAMTIRIRAISGGLARLLAGGGRVAWGLLTSNPEHQGRGAWTAARGTGLLAAAVGHTFVEYRRAG